MTDLTLQRGASLAQVFVLAMSLKLCFVCDTAGKQLSSQNYLSWSRGISSRENGLWEGVSSQVFSAHRWALRLERWAAKTA